MTRLLLIVFLMIPVPARATITILEKNSWRFSAAGFVEMDAFIDTTRSFLEAQGNTPVLRADVTAGKTGRTQYSMRNSRLQFDIDAPKVGAWSTNASFEFDFMGFDPEPPVAGNTETSFMSSPTFRARELFVHAANEDGWEAIVGQYWSLFGWQPYYFSSHADVAPLAGTLNARDTQLRGMKTFNFGNGNSMALALAVSRPPQRDAQLPALDGGIRAVLGKRKAGYTTSTAGPRALRQLSVGLSGTAREFETPRTGGQVGEVSYFPGLALAFDAFVPVWAANAGSEVPDNTVSFVVEGTIGRGYGDLFPGWSGNLSTNAGGGNLDPGIGGQDALGNFRLIEMRSASGSFQYQLPDPMRTWFSLGYGQMFSTNAGLFVGGNGLKVYTRDETYFVNTFHDLADHLRIGLEYVFSSTSYTDGPVAHNHRIQLGTWFTF
ncbi:MAG: hypothetical protein HY074_13605 [Deltaproteobacteria bacterium]|nr:hypothetical protein [Deltaproteobacteria bacterium]